MKFFDRIVERDVALFKDLQENACGYGIVLYGADHMAKRLYNILSSKGFVIDFAVVDDRYAEDEHELKSIPVLPLSTVVSRSEKYNYIISFFGYLSENGAKLLKNAHNIFHYDIVRGITDESRLNTPYSYYQRHLSDVEWLAGKLEDSISVDTLFGYINQRISGKLEYAASHYSPGSYYKEFIAFSEDEIFMDCGAKDGDTVSAFLNCLERRDIEFSGKIYAVEPDANNFKQLGEKIIRDDCVFLNVAVWSENARLEFKTCRKSSSSTLARAVDTDLIKYETLDIVDARRIDTILNGDPISFLKMDVEGAELEALRGAECTIKKYKPKLAICLYHKEEDLFTIPRLIERFDSTYTMYLRWHSHTLTELVLYAL